MSKTNVELDAALGYAQRGWSIIPVVAGTKVAVVKWRSFQEQPADDAQIREWFASGQQYGLAVVLGRVSGGLCCRDFDVRESYDRWKAAHPELASRLPTVETSRGAHVYFRAENRRFVDLGDGEYRGDSGHYCVVPPSRHPDGPEYRWIVPLEDEVPFVDPREAGLAVRWTDGSGESPLLPPESPVSDTVDTAEFPRH